MAATLTIPLTTLPVGVHTFPSSGGVAIADTLTDVNLTIDRTVVGGFNSLTPGTTASIEVWQSNDNGATFGFAVSGIMEGGGTAPVSAVGCDLNLGTSRQMKARVVVAGSSVAVAGTLAMS